MMETLVNRRIVRIAFLAALASALLLVLCLPASADLGKPKNARARARLDEGNKLYRLGEFERAIAEYKAGALIEDAPVFLYNLGQCHRQLGHYDEATWFYSQYLARGNVPPEVDQAVRKFIADMKAEKERAARTDPPSEPTPPEHPRQRTQNPVTPDERLIPPAASGEERVPWYRDGVGWGVTASGVVMLAVAAGFFVSASGLEADSDALPSQADRMAMLDKASTRRIIGAAISLGGASLTILGIVKLAWTESPTPTTTTSLFLRISPTGLALSRTF